MGALSRGSRSATIGSMSAPGCSISTMNSRHRSGTARWPARKSGGNPIPSNWRGCSSCWSWRRRGATTASSRSDSGKRSKRSSSSWPGSPPCTPSGSRRLLASPSSVTRRAAHWSRPAPWRVSSSIAMNCKMMNPARSAVPRSIPIARVSPRWRASWPNRPSVSVSWSLSGSGSIINIFKGKASGSNWPAS
ncbi:hypothetical protein D3C80_1134660 [compost metagenome]